MFCTNCGSEVSENAAFCRNCGAAVDLTAMPVESALPEPQTQKPVCPTCGRELEHQMAYCCYCGVKMDSGTPSPVPPDCQTPSEAHVADTKDNPILVIWTRWYPYKLLKAKAYGKADGNLYVYRNRLAFKPTHVGGYFSHSSLAGLAVGKVRAITSTVVSFPMDEIAAAQEMATPLITLELTMKSGEIHTFSPLIRIGKAFIKKERDKNAQLVRECVKIIQSNLH